MVYSKTVEQLLINAFTGESLARNRYTFFAKIADKEGYKQVRDVFIETANNEQEHAKLFYKHISEGKHFIDAEYPFFIGNTLENLKFSADGEQEEWEFIYRNSADIAKEEGFSDIANLFNNIIEIEKHHEHRYRQLYDAMLNNTMFKKDYQAQWECKKCGFILINENAPKECPCCKHDTGHFKIFCEKY